MRSIFEKNGVDFESGVTQLDDVVPGLRSSYDHSKSRQVWTAYADVYGDAAGRFLVGRRLASSQHYRLYFSLTAPVGAVDSDMINRFVTMAETTPAKAAELFLDLARSERPQGGSMAEPLLDGVLALSDQLPVPAIEGVLKAIAEGADEGALTEGEGEMGWFSLWLTADKLFERLVPRLPEDDRSRVIADLYSQGRSLGWLVDIARDQVFAHGFYGSQSKPVDQRILNAAEFDRMRVAMLSRLDSADPHTILNTPRLLSLMYGWQQAGGNDAVRKWIALQTASDAGFLELLRKMRTKRTATNGKRTAVTYPLTHTNLRNFLDTGVVQQRLLRIKEMDGSEHQALAAELLLAFEEGQEDL